MKLLLLNYAYLQHELRELGHEVTSAGLLDDCDIVCSINDYDIPAILSKLDFKPDWIIFMDSIERVIPTGLDLTDIPLAAFFIDSTLNRFWQYPLAEICSLVMTDQKPDADYLWSKEINAHWLPLAADTMIYQPTTVEKEYDLTFVGHRHPQNRIKRENILNALSNRYHVSFFTGDPHLSAAACAIVYQRSKLVLNENLFPSVNLRLIEAMACGTTVLTEANAPGLSDLFVDKRDLVAYDPDNLFEVVDHYLDNQAECVRIANRAAVTAGREHSFHKRAEQLTKFLDSSHNKEMPSRDKPVLIAETFLNYGLKWSKKDLGRSHGESRRLLDTASTESDPIRLHGLEGLLGILGGDLNAATQSFQSALDLAPESGAALDMLSVTKMALLDQQDGSGRLVDINFHLQRGELLLKSGHAFQPGLMAQALPVHFWSALEHFMFAAQHAPEVWELVGDLLMKAEAADQAANAYRAAAEPNQDKIQEADKLAYALL